MPVLQWTYIILAFWSKLITLLPFIPVIHLFFVLIFFYASINCPSIMTECECFALLISRLAILFPFVLPLISMLFYLFKLTAFGVNSHFVLSILLITFFCFSVLAFPVFLCLFYYCYCHLGICKNNFVAAFIPID